MKKQKSPVATVIGFVLTWQFDMLQADVRDIAESMLIYLHLRPGY